MRTLNMQPIERQLREGEFPGLEIVGTPWQTIQGEGPFAGRAAVFVRLAGCTLRCPGCDTNYTDGRQQVSVEALAEEVNTLAEISKPCGWRKQPTGRIVVLTGGEPFRQDVLPFVRQMTAGYGRLVQIETNGFTEPIGPDWHVWNPLLTVVVSPKLTVEPTIWKLARHAKYVLRHDKVTIDGLPTSALGYQAKPDRPPTGWPGTIYVQPEDTGDEDTDRLNRQKCVEVAQQFGYVVSLQTHKILGVP